MGSIRKAVFPVAGLGTRFLPATKATPKEMLPIVDKPLIQYAAEEAIAAGIRELIFITGRTKNAVIDHFDKAYELEAELEARHKHDLLDVVRNIVPPKVTCIFIRQAEPLGLGHAVACARPAVGAEPFAVILPDDLIDGDDMGCIAQMVALYEEHLCSVLAVQVVDPQDSDKYGIVSCAAVEGPKWVNAIIEKPPPSQAPSNLAVVGRYVLTPRIFDCLEQTQQGTGGEIQLTDAIEKLLGEEKVLAHAFSGARFDCGSKLGYLEATVAYALRHPEFSREFREYLRNLPGEDNAVAG